MYGTVWYRRNFILFTALKVPYTTVPYLSKYICVVPYRSVIFKASRIVCPQSTNRLKFVSRVSSKCHLSTYVRTYIMTFVEEVTLPYRYIPYKNIFFNINSSHNVTFS